MDITKWKDTWGTINWEKDPEAQIIQKITDFYHAGVDFNMESKEDGGMRPLMYAAQHSSTVIVDLLIDGGADPSLTDFSNRTVLQCASIGGKTKNAEYLIEHGPRKLPERKDAWQGTAVHMAAYNGNTDIIKILYKYNPNLISEKDIGGETALHKAAVAGSVEAAKLLLKYNSNLIKEKTNKEYTALHMAVNNDKVEMAELLLAYDPLLVNEANMAGCTPLHLATANNNLKMIKMLIEHGANINAQDKEDKTPLIKPIYDGHTKTVKTLIELGADVNIKDLWGQSALSCADNLIIKRLIKNANKVRADYLKKQSKGSLRKTLKSSSDKKEKGIFAAIFREQKDK